MPRKLQGWLEKIVEYNARRPVIKKERSREIRSLRSRIESVYSRGGVAVIAEFKPRSPSGFTATRDPIEYTRFVEKYAVGLSVLTEELYFGGSYELLANIASETRLPVLMKDFIITPGQIETAYSLGADAVLLIASILTERELDVLYETAKNLGLEALVEVHSEDEAEQVSRMGYPLVGVNARNLNTLEVSLDRAYRILGILPDSLTKVAESGIKSRHDIEYLRKAGAKAFLIGSELMKNPEKIIEFTR